MGSDKNARRGHCLRNEAMNDSYVRPADMNVVHWQKLLETGIDVIIAHNYDLVKPFFTLFMQPGMASELRAAEEVFDEMTHPCTLPMVDREPVLGSVGGRWDE